MWRAVFALMFSAFSTAQAQSLCPVTPPLVPEAPEFQITEGDFTENRALSSLNWLENDVWALLKEHKTTNELRMNTEGFGIPYPNSLKIVRGTFLRQRALLMQALLEIERYKHKAGTTTKKMVEDAERQFVTAREEFCVFLRSAEYVD